MNYQEIKRLVRKGENQHVEFKRKVKYPEKIVKEIVAFANTDGGHLFIGVDDDLSIPGLRFAEEEDFIMQKAISELCRPAIEYETEIVPINEDYAVIHYHIFESKLKPHFAFYKKEHRFGKAFIRIQDRSVQASTETRKVLKRLSQSKDSSFAYGEYEEMIMHYLNDHKSITLQTFVDMSKLPIKKASDILVTLVVSQVIKLIPGEKFDQFIYNE